MEDAVRSSTRRAFLAALVTAAPSAALAASPRRLVLAQPFAIGMASYYGPREEGRRTASGEIFHAHGYTAAHRRLAFGTMLRVTNLQNGLSVVVKVNDRGPYAGNQIIDLSQRAARDLDMYAAGLARVSLTVVGA